MESRRDVELRLLRASENLSRPGVDVRPPNEYLSADSIARKRTHSIDEMPAQGPHRKAGVCREGSKRQVLTRSSVQRRGLWCGPPRSRLSALIAPFNDFRHAPQRPPRVRA